MNYKNYKSYRNYKNYRNYWNYRNYGFEDKLRSNNMKYRNYKK